jgi:hypothetical protein
MHVYLEMTQSTDYFNKTNREIDWDENDKTKVSIKMAEALQNILTTEASIYLLRRVTGVCGSLADDMVGIRRRLISEYEKIHEPYVFYRDFY